MSSFLSLAESGKQEWWRYLLSIFSIIFFWFIIGSIPYVIQEYNHVVGIEWNFVNTMSSFLFLLLGLLFAVRFIHRRSFISLVTSYTTINWKRYMYGFSVTMVLLILFTLIDYLVHPQYYRFVLAEWSIQGFMLIFILGLLLIPLQAAAEELLFRGYLLQSLGTRLKNPFILATITSIPFALVHSANPEVSKGFLPMMLFYFSFGCMASLITIRSNSLELAMGVHGANNIFALLIVNQSDSVVPSRPIFLLDTWDPWNSVASAAILLSLLYYILSRSLKRDIWKKI